MIAVWILLGITHLVFGVIDNGLDWLPIGFIHLYGGWFVLNIVIQMIVKSKRYIV